MADHNKIYDDICDVLHDQIKKIARKGDAITAQELDNVYKAVDVLKDIATIKAMETEYPSDYSADYSGRYYYPRSYGHEQVSRDMSHEQWGNSRDHGDGSYRRGRDAQTGRYVSRDGSSYDDGSYEYNDHSRATETERMIKKLEEMMKNTSSEREVNAIKQCIDRISR